MNFAAVAYADIFDYPLTESELHLWQIKAGSEPSAIRNEVKDGSEPFNCERTHGFWHLSGRSKIISLRRRRLRFNQLKWRRAKQTAKLLSFIPWIKLVAATGALAMNNCRKDDDIDLMIITAKNRLWLTRLLATILLFPHLRQGPTLKDKSLKRSDLDIKAANKLCLNLWLDESAFSIKNRNLYVAHEICQSKPLYNRDAAYQKFINANLWVKKFLPNWTPQQPAGSEPAGKKRSVLEAKLRGRTLMDFLEFLAFHLQYAYMKPKMTRERVGPHFAFFHPRPTGEIVLQKYQQRLQGRSLTLQGPTLKDKFEKRSDLIGIKILVTGVFDILHSEHKKLLLAAKKLGGTLLVGLETDARARQLKGHGRPVNSLRLRLKNLQQLGIADKVFALPEQFNDLNHFINFIEKLRPDILAVSSSTPHLAIKRRIMKHFKGRIVVVLPHNPKISTSKLLKPSL